MVETTIKHHKKYSIERFYHGQTFFWGVRPKLGDVICFKFSSVQMILTGFKFVSGNAEHPLGTIHKDVSS